MLTKGWWERLKTCEFLGNLALGKSGWLVMSSIETTDAGQGKQLAGRRLFPAATAKFVSDVVAFAIALPIAIIVSDAIRTWAGVPNAHQSVLHLLTTHLQLTLPMIIAVLFGLASRKHYRTTKTLSAEFKDITVACTLALLATSFVHYSAKFDMSRTFVYSTWIASFALLLCGRLSLRWLLAGKQWQTPVVLLGKPSRRTSFNQALQKHPELGIRIVGRLDCSDVANQLRESTPEQAIRIVRQLQLSSAAETIIVAPPPEEFADGLVVVNALQRAEVQFTFAPELGSMPVENLTLQHFAPFDGLMITPGECIERPVARFIKRSVETTLAMISVVVGLPFWLVITILVKRDGGPVLFKQTRVGKNGEEFQCLKFRTMSVDAEECLKQLLKDNPALAEEWAKTKKLRSDPRVTSIGCFLRRTSLDELPQLLNVIRGEMAIVGPRPVVPGELERYGEDIPYYTRVRPGITGMWQVNGRNATSYNERVRLDAYYVRNWTLWRDLSIAVKTIPLLTFGRDGI